MTDTPGTRGLSGKGLWLARFLLAMPALLLVAVVVYVARSIVKEPASAEAPAYYLDEESGLRLKGNQSRSYPRRLEHGGEKIPWETNADGYRGPPLRNDAEQRIVVLGDSNIQAQFSTLENTYPMQLQKLLSSRTGKRVEVINAGTVGAGPDQSLARLEKEVPQLHPSLVIFHVFCDNDFGDLIRNALYSTSSDGNLVRSGRKFLSDPAFGSRSLPPALLSLQGALGMNVSQRLRRKAPQGASTPAELIQEKLQVCADEFADYQERIAGADIPLPGIFADHYDFDLALDPELESSRTKVALMNGVLRRVRAFSVANKVEVVVLIEPSAQDLTDTQPLTPEMLTAASPQYRPDALSGLVQAMAEKNQLAFINLYPRFKEHASRLYFRWTDDHWNDEGQAVAAQVTADFLVARGMAP